MEYHTTGLCPDRGLLLRRRPPIYQNELAGQLPLSFTHVDGIVDDQSPIHSRNDCKQAPSVIRLVQANLQLLYAWLLDLLDCFCPKIRAPSFLRPGIQQVCIPVVTDWMRVVWDSFMGTSTQRLSAHDAHNKSPMSTVAPNLLFGLGGSDSIPGNFSSFEDSEGCPDYSLDADDKEPRPSQGLAALEIYEAVMRPADQTATIDVIFDTRTNQWQLGRADSGMRSGSQLSCLRRRDQQVLVLCSTDLLAGLASDGCSITIYDQKGQPSEHLTKVHHLSQKHGVPGFRAGELSQLRLSSHDGFRIHNLKDFLLYANDNIHAAGAVTVGPYMKTWIITLSQLTLIMDDPWTYKACQKAFFKLHKRGYAKTLYLQLLDGDYDIGLDTRGNAEILRPNFWMTQYANFVPSSLRINAIKAFSFFCLDRQCLVCPETYVIHPDETPMRAPMHHNAPIWENGQCTRNNGGASKSHLPITGQCSNWCFTQASSAEDILGSVSPPEVATLPRFCNQDRHSRESARSRDHFSKPLPHTQRLESMCLPATKVAPLHQIALGPCETAAKSYEEGHPGVSQHDVLGRHNMQDIEHAGLRSADGASQESVPHGNAPSGWHKPAGVSDEASKCEAAANGLKLPVSAPPFTAEEYHTTLTTAHPPVKRLPLSYYFKYVEGYHPGIQAANVSHAFAEQIDSVDYSWIKMEESGLAYNREIRDWVSPPDAAESKGQSDGDGEQRLDWREELACQNLRREIVEYSLESGQVVSNSGEATNDDGDEESSNILDASSCGSNVLIADSDSPSRSLEVRAAESHEQMSKVRCSPSLRGKAPALDTNEDEEVEGEGKVEESGKVLLLGIGSRTNLGDKTEVPAEEVDLHGREEVIGDGDKDMLDCGEGETTGK